MRQSYSKKALMCGLMSLCFLVPTMVQADSMVDYMHAIARSSDMSMVYSLQQTVDVYQKKINLPLALVAPRGGTATCNLPISYSADKVTPEQIKEFLQKGYGKNLQDNIKIASKSTGTPLVNLSVKDHQDTPITPRDVCIRFMDYGSRSASYLYFNLPPDVATKMGREGTLYYAHWAMRNEQNSSVYTITHRQIPLKGLVEVVAMIDGVRLSGSNVFNINEGQFLEVRQKSKKLVMTAQSRAQLVQKIEASVMAELGVEARIPMVAKVTAKIAAQLGTAQEETAETQHSVTWTEYIPTKALEICQGQCPAMAQ